MSKIRFRSTVTHVMKWLAQFDYHLVDGSDGATFAKIISKGVRGEIEFQLLQNYVAPVRSMDVILRRKRLPDFRASDTSFKPLVMSVRFLMKSRYGKDIIPDGNELWNFSDELSLTQQLATIQEPLREYAIKWLENPQSEM